MALTMIIIFIIVAVVGRVLLQYRLTGDHGVRSTKPSSLGIAKFTSALITIAFMGTAVISVLSALFPLEPQFHFGSYSKIIGVLLCLGGIILTSISQVQMGKEWRIGVDDNEKTKLVTHGIYSAIRNPIYTGVMLFGLGMVFLIPHLAMLTIAVLGYIAIELHVRKVEEPYLKNLHGQLFTNYVSSTGRYIPKWK